MDVVERFSHDAELAPGAVAARRGAGELRQLADHDVDGSPGEEARSRPPSRGTARSSRGRGRRGSGRASPVDERDRRDELRCVCRRRPRSRAPPRRRRPQATSSARSRSAARCRTGRRSGRRPPRRRGRSRSGCRRSRHSRGSSGTISAVTAMPAARSPRRHCGRSAAASRGPGGAVTRGPALHRSSRMSVVRVAGVVSALAPHNVTSSNSTGRPAAAISPQGGAACYSRRPF